MRKQSSNFQDDVLLEDREMNCAAEINDESILCTHEHCEYLFIKKSIHYVDEHNLIYSRDQLV